MMQPFRKVLAFYLCILVFLAPFDLPGRPSLRGGAAAPAQTVVQVPAGADIGAMVNAAKPYTSFVLKGTTSEPNTSSVTMHPPAYCLISGGYLTCKPSPGASSIFDVSAANFYLHHLSINPTSASVIVDTNAPNTTLYYVAVHNTCSSFVLAYSKAANLSVTFCTEAQSCSEGIYILGAPDAVVTDNTIGTSLGEASVRVDNDSTVTPPVLPVNLTFLRNRVTTHNSFGKQCLEIRYCGSGNFGDGKAADANTFDGAIRVGQTAGPHAVTCSILANQFINAYGVPSTAGTNAIQVYGYTTAVIDSNVFSASACIVSPIVVSGPADAVSISGNTSHGPKPLLATSSHGAYTSAANTLK